MDENEELKFLRKLKKKKNICFGGVGVVGSGWSGWGVRVDVNGELKFLGKFTKKNRGGGRGVRLGGGGGVRVDLNEELKFL